MAGVLRTLLLIEMIRAHKNIEENTAKIIVMHNRCGSNTETDLFIHFLPHKVPSHVMHMVSISASVSILDLISILSMSIGIIPSLPALFLPYILLVGACATSL